MTAAPSQNPRPATRLWATPVPFDQELCGLVLDTAPQLFAVVQVYDDSREGTDGWVVAWGLANGDGPTYVVGVDGRTRLTLASPERAVHLFTGQPGITARLVWLAQPGTATLDRTQAA
ncbi:hypothetical protein [Kitasatospora sp. NPDC087315]|uniref:hypothetical protein n=1 Tax=Kitasatospora sp. NPDC087315 TaxID=3364069 RepID=UPI0037FF68C9